MLPDVGPNHMHKNIKSVQRPNFNHWMAYGEGHRKSNLGAKTHIKLYTKIDIQSDYSLDCNGCRVTIPEPTLG